MTGCGGTWELRLTPLNCGMGVQNTIGENNSPNLSHMCRLSNLGIYLLIERIYVAVWLHKLCSGVKVDETQKWVRTGARSQAICFAAHKPMCLCLFFSCYWEEKDPQKTDCAERISEGGRKWRGERVAKSWEDRSKHKGWGGAFWPGWVKECWSSACATPESFPKLVALTERRWGDHPASGAGVNFYTRDPENTSHCLTWTVSKRYKFGISSLGDWLSNVHTPPAFESSVHREGMGQDKRIGWGRTFLCTAVSAGTKQHDLWKAVIFREELFLGCLSGL